MVKDKDDFGRDYQFDDVLFHMSICSVVPQVLTRCFFTVP